MKYKKIAFGGLVVLLFSAIACEKDRLDILPQEEKGVELNTEISIEGISLNSEFGFLEFENEKTYRKTMTALEENQNIMGYFESHFVGFTSQAQAFEEIDTEEEFKEVLNNPENHSFKNFLRLAPDEGSNDLEARRVVESPRLARIVSENGLLKVGGLIQKMAPKRILSAKNPTRSQIQEMINWDGEVSLSFGEVEAIHLSKIPRIQDECRTSYNGGRRGRTLFRVVGEQFENDRNVGGTRTIDWIVRTKHQRRFGGVWWPSNNADVRILADDEYRMGNTGAFIPFTIDTTNPGASQVEDETELCGADNGTPPCFILDVNWRGGSAIADHIADPTGGEPNVACRTEAD
ncbi:MAG: hypothetical protein AAF696_19200 [Bacteroidota bacterium]